MIIRNMTRADAESIADFWNANLTGLYFKPFAEGGFEKKLLDHPSFNPDLAFICEEDCPDSRRFHRRKITGIAAGLLPGGQGTAGYLPLLFVGEEYRRRGIGSALLAAVEDALRGAGAVRIESSFRSPVNFEWFIPGTPGHDHPGAPGVLTGSAAHMFLMGKGYSEGARLTSYYRTLENFEINEKIKNKIAELSEKNITIELYKAEIRRSQSELSQGELLQSEHSPDDSSLSELFDNLRSEGWRREITSAVASGKPVLFAFDRNRGGGRERGHVCGFTGPLYIQPSGRGYFAGIGVHSDYNGMGIGSALFNRLCEEHRKLGSGFMSLFTGVPVAKRIYEGAGFAAVAEWGMLIRGLSL